LVAHSATEHRDVREPGYRSRGILITSTSAGIMIGGNMWVLVETLIEISPAERTQDM
jgi:hypothetical protein